ncbi:hypothetical protein [Streptomyces sp. NBC_01601]|uniref:hypothetical protein n=1 Tax=Streptomyces sp. NBC_01601 TaxID=2975892 RepID=UPI002E2AACE8|nr:hypothetical protein [Streptomyces sp. NBC_01601]
MTSRPATIRHDTEVPGIGSVVMHVTTLEHGHVRYTVRGPHVRGTFVVIPEALRNGTVLPSTVKVQFGDDADPADDDGAFWNTHRPDEPVMHNVRLHGWTEGIDPDNPPSGYYLGRYATSLRDNGMRRELTFGVRRRTEALIRVLVRHWSALPHRHELILAAARRKAANLAKHEAEEAAALEAQIAKLQSARKKEQARLNAVLGVLRRRPLPIRPADPAPVKVPIVDNASESMGVLTVREVTVNEVVPGTVVYEVSGARVEGRFTVGRDRSQPRPVPEGLRVAYGHMASDSPFAIRQEREPEINGVRIGGYWNWDHRSSDAVTPTTPARLPASAYSGVRAGMSASSATERRASAVLRALALRYLARRDAAGLQLAAAQGQAPHLLRKCREQLHELRIERRDLQSQASRHRAREEQYRALIG